MTLRVVFDTSALVSAALRPDSVADRALQRSILFHQVIASSETLEELNRVLAREKFDRYVGSSTRRTFFEKFKRDSLHLPVGEAEIREVLGACRDTKDDPFLALALAAKAEVVVSSDKDLLVLHPWRGIAILTPAQFLEQFNP
jgi:uncharacterized protein